MADDANPPSPFDVQTIKHLVTLMSRHDLSEIDLRDGHVRLRLRRGPRRVAVTSAPAAVPTPPPVAAAAPAAVREEPAQPARVLAEIKSPGPGMFYAKPNPESPPFVSRGSRVTPATIVGLLEAMKVYNEINADCSGVVVEIVAEDGKPVEYGQVLFRVDPAG